MEFLVVMQQLAKTPPRPSINLVLKRYGFEYDLNKDIIHAVREGIFIMTQCKLYFAKVRRNCFCHLCGKANKYSENFVCSVQHNGSCFDKTSNFILNYLN